MGSGGYPSLYINASDQVGLAFPSNTGWNTDYNPGGSVPRNTWSHLAATYDGAGNYQVYLNGQPVGDDSGIPGSAE
jgi:hypothetical protein